MHVLFIIMKKYTRKRKIKGGRSPYVSPMLSPPPPPPPPPKKEKYNIISPTASPKKINIISTVPPPPPKKKRYDTPVFFKKKLRFGKPTRKTRPHISTPSVRTRHDTDNYKHFKELDMFPISQEHITNESFGEDYKKGYEDGLMLGFNSSYNSNELLYADKYWIGLKNGFEHGYNDGKNKQMKEEEEEEETIRLQ